MSALNSWVLEYLLNSLWQVPLVFLAGWLVARLMRRVGPSVEHRVWVSALLLEVTLPACHLRVGDLMREASGFLLSGWSGHAAGGQIQVTIGPGSTYGNGVLRLPAEILAGIAVMYGCSLLYLRDG
jgi:hypothetical protein